MLNHDKAMQLSEPYGRLTVNMQFYVIAAMNHGQNVNKAKLAREIGCRRETIQRYAKDDKISAIIDDISRKCQSHGEAVVRTIYEDLCYQLQASVGASETTSKNLTNNQRWLIEVGIKPGRLTDVIEVREEKSINASGESLSVVQQALLQNQREREQNPPSPE